MREGDTLVDIIKNEDTDHPDIFNNKDVLKSELLNTFECFGRKRKSNCY